MLKRHLLSLIIFVMIGSPSFTQEMGVDSLIQEVFKNYRSLEQFADSGIIISQSYTLVGKPLSAKKQTNFSLQFIRSNLYEIEYYAFGRVRIKDINGGIHWNPITGDTLFWIIRGDRPRQLKPKPLVNCIAMSVGGFGTSYGLNMAKLLKVEEEISGKAPLKGFDESQITEEELGIEECYVLELQYINHDLDHPIWQERKKNGFTITLEWTRKYWIRKSDFMIVQIAENRFSEKKRYEQIIRMNPKTIFDQALKVKKFDW
ncbi:MAG: hypothetical protein MK226_02490 [Saprospiraceae bacterium]|nr:hypothetical protein [Saprospiraceae bacterium]